MLFEDDSLNPKKRLQAPSCNSRIPFINRPDGVSDNPSVGCESSRRIPSRYSKPIWEPGIRRGSDLGISTKRAAKKFFSQRSSYYGPVGLCDGIQCIPGKMKIRQNVFCRQNIYPVDGMYSVQENIFGRQTFY